MAFIPLGFTPIPITDGSRADAQVLKIRGYLTLTQFNGLCRKPGAAASPKTSVILCSRLNKKLEMPVNMG